MSNLEKIMGEHLTRCEEYWFGKYGEYPLTSVSSRIEPLLYVGEVRGKGTTQWRFQEKMRIHDFSAIEEKWGVTLHHDIKQYFNSFWFLDFPGFIGDQFYSLFRCPPGRELEEFYICTTGYQDAHGGSLEYIPLGTGTDQSLLVVVHNETGAVYLEDYEFGTYERIAYSLEDLIRQFHPSMQPPL